MPYPPTFRFLPLVQARAIIPLIGLLTVLGVGTMSAQNLQTVVCPVGAPNFIPFGMTEASVADPGTPLLRRTLSGPDSLCNDGTPAVMYIRPATTNFNGYLDNGMNNLPQDGILNERWVIIFHGGGGCGDEDGCLDRWCSATGKSMDRASKMSTAGAYDAIRGTGILKRRPDNHFAGYNHVLLNYCSSDNWAGSDSKVAVGTSSGVTYDLEFQGESIVNDAFTTLLSGAVSPDAGLGFWQDSLPPLTSAEEIVLVGDSAGSGGLRHHLDRLADRLGILVPGATVVGVADAGLTPARSGSGIDWSSAPVPDYAGYLNGPVLDRFNFWGVDDSALDQSCLDPAFAAVHAADGGTHPEICYDTTYTLYNHLTTNYFVGMDINDTLARQGYIDWSLFSNAWTYWATQFNELDALASGPLGWEFPPWPVGVFGPKCDQHVRINGREFFSQQVVSPGGALGLSYHDLLVNWLGGVPPISQIQEDSLAGPAYSSSFCP